MNTIRIFRSLADLDNEPRRPGLVVTSERVAAMLGASLHHARTPWVYVALAVAHLVRVPPAAARSTNVEFLGDWALAHREHLQNLILKGETP